MSDRRAMPTDRRAFTLLEMLLATVLSTILLIGVLAVVVSLGVSGMAADSAVAALPPNKVGADSPAMVGVIETWASLLREDLIHSRMVNMSAANELTLVGNGALDASGRGRSHRPASVVYKVEDVDGRRWVIRRQAALDVLTNLNIQRDIVCGGVRRFDLTRSADLSAWRLKVWTSDAREPAYDQIITIQSNGGV